MCFPGSWLCQDEFEYLLLNTLTEVDEERKLGTFNEKHMATEVAIDALSKEWKGYVVQIMIITMKFCLEAKCLGPRRLCLLLIIDQGELVIQYIYISLGMPIWM